MRQYTQRNVAESIRERSQQRRRMDRFEEGAACNVMCTGSKLVKPANLRSPPRLCIMQSGARIALGRSAMDTGHVGFQALTRVKIFRAGVTPLQRVCPSASLSAPGKALLLASLLGITAASLLGAGSSVPAAYIPTLPAGAVARSLVVDANGNLLVVGAIQPKGGEYKAQDAFLAKLSPDGQTLLYYKLFAGSDADVALGVAVDAAGSVVVAGATSSQDFPTTTNVLESELNGATSAGFITKIDPSGKVLYSTFFGGGAGQSTSIRSIAVNASGEVFLTGQTVGGNFVTTTSSIHPHNPLNTVFTSRISAGGDHLIYSVAGLGGTSIAVDSASNAYITGSGTPDDDIPITTGAYQSNVPQTLCSATMQFGYPCIHQYAAKLDPTGNNVLFCTFVSGSYQDSPSAIFVDANGNVYIAGTTGSTDYPVTTGAFQRKNTVLLPPPPLNWDTFVNGPYLALPNTGYVTKLSSDGTHLIYSSFLGGSQADSVTGLAVDSKGQAFVSLQVQSSDFPGLPAVPLRCLPDRLHDLPVVVTLDAKGSAVISTVAVEGVSSGASQQGLVLSGQGGAYLLTDGPYLANTLFASSAADPIACITDSFDYTTTGKISPGQLVTIFGSSLGPETPSSYDPQSSMLPTILGGTAVLINGVASPLLYVSQNQINLTVPYEVSGETAATLQLKTASSGTGQRTIVLAALTPSLANGGVTAYPVCGGGTPIGSTSGVVLNEDSTQNSCANPAKAGSLVRVFLNGTGINNPGSTGVIPQTQVPLTPVVADMNHQVVERTISVPGAPLGVWEADIRLARSYPGPFLNTQLPYTMLQLTVGDVAVREKGVAVWVAQ
jgi:uncharacterized protein (TIGR03437 family)